MSYKSSREKDVLQDKVPSRCIERISYLQKLIAAEERKLFKYIENAKNHTAIK